MNDPFGLSQVKKAPVQNAVVSQDQPKKAISKKGKITIIAIAIGLLVFFLGAFYILLKRSVSADTNISNANIDATISSIATNLKTGGEFSPTLTLSNKNSAEIKFVTAFIYGKNLDLLDSLELSRNLAENQRGFMRRLAPDELKMTDQNVTSGLYVYFADLGGNQTLSQALKAKIAGSGDDANIQVKVFTSVDQFENCGFLNVLRCQSQDKLHQIAFYSDNISVTRSSSIVIHAGYNFISLPFIFAANDLKQFFLTLPDQKSYYYKTPTAEFLNITQNENHNYIKPGVGFWIFDSSGGEYDLPPQKVETNINESFVINMDIGWNFIGNPYNRRIILSADKIMIKDLADDGTPNGTLRTLKDVITSGDLSAPQTTSHQAVSDSTGLNNIASQMKFTQLALGSIIKPYSAIAFNAKKKLAIVLPGLPIVAQGDTLSDSEKMSIETWISKNNYNQYGDPSGTVYSGGTPLDETTQTEIDRYDYILSKHPERPWQR